MRSYNTPDPERRGGPSDVNLTTGLFGEPTVRPEGYDVCGHKFVSLIGSGAFSHVYAARDPHGAPCVLKIPLAPGGGSYLGNPRDRMLSDAFEINSWGHSRTFLDGYDIQRLFNEKIALMPSLKGGLIERDRAVLDDNGTPVLVSEFIPGSSLRQIMLAAGTVRLNWLALVARGLVRNIEEGQLACHGNIKPENIFIPADSSPRLLSPVPRVERLGHLVTTPAYYPLLEQTTRGDTRAIGLILYELLTGSNPLTELAPWEGAHSPSFGSEDDARRFLSLRDPTLENPNCPPMLARITMNCISEEGYDLRDFLEDVKKFYRTI